MAANALKESQPRAEAGEDGLASAGESRARLVIVEDDFILAFDLQQCLEDEGFEVLGRAATADQAVALARTARPDLLIMDIRLIGLRDGVDAAREIYESLGIRSIFASAFTDDATRERAKKAEPFGFVAKPYQMNSLVSLIAGAVGTR